MKITKFTRLATILEVTLLYVLIQAFIWRWQFTHPGLAWPLFLFLLSTHVWHKDTMSILGFRLDNFLPCLKLGMLAFVPFILVLTFVGLLSGRIWTILGHWQIVRHALRYIFWATFQQYGLQGYFHHRVMKAISNPMLSSIISGLIFMSLHFPNPVLMIFTLLGGFALSVVYSKEPNIFALGIFHGLIGLWLANSFPREILHNMRVGPGYYR